MLFEEDKHVSVLLNKASRSDQVAYSIMQSKFDEAYSRNTLKMNLIKQ